ncbi:MAG: hypothetical protein M3Z04_21075 [Chloroflexota bacterium]|nr:hypothetical protein [Chloroflexota bacterium]
MAAIGIPFLDDLQQKVQRTDLTRDAALTKLSEWEDDIVNRSDEELDAAWNFRQSLDGGGPGGGSSGGPAPAQLENLLAAGLVQHIDNVLAELQNLAAANRLTDEYLMVLQTVIHEGGPRYKDQVSALLNNMPSRSPGLNDLHDSLLGILPGDQHMPEPLPQTNGHSSGGVGTVPPPPPVSEGYAPQASYTASHSTSDPWVAAQQFIALGRWDQARDSLARIPQNHPRFNEVPLLLRTIADDEVYDQIPGLRDMLGQFASSRSRRDWREFESRQEQARRLIADASTRAGRGLPTPRSLVEIFDEAIKAQDAEKLVVSAIADRRKGDFAEASNRLNEASRLDPRYTRVQIEQQRNTDLEQMLFDLRRNPLGTTHELLEGESLAEQLLAPDGAPASEVAQNLRDKINTRIESLVQSGHRFVEGQQRTIADAGNLDDKLRSCDMIEAKINEITQVRKDDPELPDMRDRLERMRRQVASLKDQRDTLVADINALNPQAGLDVTTVANMTQTATTLADDRLAKGDTGVDEAAQELANRCNAFLALRLQSNQPLDLPVLEDCAEILRLAQTGPRALTPPQVSMYTRALWQSTANMIRGHLHRSKTLPPFTPGTGPRSGAVIWAWDQAQRALDWLRTLPSAPAEQAAIDSLDQDFAQTAQTALDETGHLPTRLSTEERQERLTTATDLKQRLQTLPPSVQARLPLPLLQGSDTPAATALRHRDTQTLLRRLGTVVAVLVLLAGVGFGISRATGFIKDPVLPPSLTPEPAAGDPNLCDYINSFNICNRFRVAYKTNPAMSELLGNPVSRADHDNDPSVNTTAQYFEFGRLENPIDKPDGADPNLGNLGSAVLDAQARTDVLIAAKETPKNPSVNWTAIPKSGHFLRPDNEGGFLKYYLTDITTKRSCWKGGLGDAIRYYGLPSTEQYDDQVEGHKVTLQFFERAVFQRNPDGTVVRWPVGVMYLNQIRGQALVLPAKAPLISVNVTCSAIK